MKLIVCFLFIVFSHCTVAQVDRLNILKEKYKLVEENKNILKNIIDISYLKKCISLDMIEEKKDLVNEFGKFYSFYKKYENQDYLEKKKKYLTLSIYNEKIELPLKKLRILCENI